MRGAVGSTRPGPELTTCLALLSSCTELNCGSSSSVNSSTSSGGAVVTVDPAAGVDCTRMAWAATFAANSSASKLANRIEHTVRCAIVIYSLWVNVPNCDRVPQRVQ